MTSWLAALLAPRSIAYHPNFGSESSATAAARLAAGVLGETHRQKDPTPVPSEHQDALGSLIEAINTQSPDAVRRLWTKTTDNGLDLEIRVCAAVVATAIELEVSTPPRHALQRILASTKEPTDPTGEFLHCWLRLADAVVGVRYGDVTTAQVRGIRQTLEAIDAQRVTPPETTPGPMLEGQVVVARMVELLSDSALSWEIHLAGFSSDLWQERLRRPTPYILSAQLGRQAEGLDDWVREEFDARYRYQSSVRIGGSAMPGDVDMVEAARIPAFAFHRFAQDAALRLARSRLVRTLPATPDQSSDFVFRTALQLLRFSGHTKSLTGVAAWLVKFGPIEALRIDATDVLRSIENRGFPSSLEVKYIATIAAVLDRTIARSLFAGLLGELRGPRRESTHIWGGLTPAVPDLIEALGQLGPPSGLQDQLKDVIRLGLSLTEVDTEDVDRAIARTLRSLREFDSSIAEATLHELRSAPGHQIVRDALVSVLPQAASKTTENTENESELDAAVHYINSVIRGWRKPAAEVSARFTEPLSRAIHEIQKDAARGAYSFGGIEPIDVAVAFAVEGLAPSLWRDIVNSLADPRVSRDDKTSALQRLSRSRSRIPDRAWDGLHDNIHSILASRQTGLGHQTKSYGPGIQLAAGLGLVPHDELIAMISPLLAAREPATRAGGLECLQPLIDRNDPHIAAWVVQAAMHASFDVDPNVQTTASRLLVSSYENAARSQDLVVNRLNGLLNSDGSWLVRHVLKELEDASARVLRTRLSTRLAALAKHPDWRVRRRADALKNLD